MGRQRGPWESEFHLPPNTLGPTGRRAGAGGRYSRSSKSPKEGLIGAGLQKEETEAVSRVGPEEGYGRQSREEDSALPTLKGEAWGPGKGLRGTFQLERKGEERGEAWDRQGPRGRFTR